jgi:hypothetical protein
MFPHDSCSIPRKKTQKIRSTILQWKSPLYEGIPRSTSWRNLLLLSWLLSLLFPTSFCKFGELDKSSYHSIWCICLSSLRWYVEVKVRESISLFLELIPLGSVDPRRLCDLVRSWSLQLSCEDSSSVRPLWRFLRSLQLSCAYCPKLVHVWDRPQGSLSGSRTSLLVRKLGDNMVMHY